MLFRKMNVDPQIVSTYATRAVLMNESFICNRRSVKFRSKLRAARGQVRVLLFCLTIDISGSYFAFISGVIFYQ